MCKLLISIILVLVTVTASFGFECQFAGVVTGGTLEVEGSYYAFSGATSPAFENQAKYGYYGKGTLGVMDQGIYAGGIASQQQIQVEQGFGRFVSKVGTGVLLTNADEQNPSSTLIQNAIGFGGQMGNGIATVGFNTGADAGFMGMAEAQGIGTFRAGAVQVVKTGGAVDPVTVERSDFHWKVGPGQFQTTISITFPRMGE